MGFGFFHQDFVGVCVFSLGFSWGLCLFIRVFLGFGFFHQDFVGVCVFSLGFCWVHKSKHQNMPLPPSKFKCSILPIFFYVLSTPLELFIFLFPHPPLSPPHLPSTFHSSMPIYLIFRFPPYPHLSPFYLIFIFPPPPHPPPRRGGGVGGGNINISKGTIWFWVLGFRHRIGIRV